MPIDRSVSAMSADRQDQLGYYKTLLDFYENQKTDEGKKLVTLSADKKSFLNAQIDLLQNDLSRSQASADNIKTLMTDPNTAQFMAQAGVTLNDSPEVVNKKMSDYAYTQEKRTLDREMLNSGATWIQESQAAAIPENEKIYVQDSRGQMHQYKIANPLNKLLSISEAKSFNVPFGSTLQDVAGKVPKTTTSTSRSSTEVTDFTKAQDQQIAALGIGDLPIEVQNIILNSGMNNEEKREYINQYRELSQSMSVEPRMLLEKIMQKKSS